MGVGDAVLLLFAESGTVSGLPELSTLIASPSLRIENFLLLWSPYDCPVPVALSASMRSLNERRKKYRRIAIAMSETPL
jgi:hypothetical protein